MKSKVIQIIKDLHVVFLGKNDPRTLLCEYRVLIEDSDGRIHLVSVEQKELDGSMNADDLLSLRRRECYHAPIETIVASIDAWINNDNTKRESIIETVLNGFLKTELIGSNQYHVVRKYYNLE